MKKLIDPFELVAAALNTRKETLTIDSKMHEHPDWDSVENIAVIADIETYYGIAIDDADVMKYNNMKAIFVLYENLQK